MTQYSVHSDIPETATIRFGVHKGDIYVYNVTNAFVDSKQNYTVKVLADPVDIDEPVSNITGIPSLNARRDGITFEVTSPDGNISNYDRTYFIYPISATYRNGSVLSLSQMIEKSYLKESVSIEFEETNVTISVPYGDMTFSMTYNLSNGVFLSYWGMFGYTPYRYSIDLLEFHNDEILPKQHTSTPQSPQSPNTTSTVGPRLFENTLIAILVVVRGCRRFSHKHKQNQIFDI